MYIIASKTLSAYKFHDVKRHRYLESKKEDTIYKDI